MKKNTLDHIYESYMMDIYRYLLSLCGNSYVAEDIMQETFLRAYLHFEACTTENVKPWLFKIAHNAYIDYKRKECRSYAEEKEFFDNISDCKTTEEQVLIKEQLNEINDFIGKLPENQKQAILLCDYNDLSYKEASEVMGVSLPRFKVLLFRARQNIRQKAGSGDKYE